jgi:hypothetical protein
VLSTTPDYLLGATAVPGSERDRCTGAGDAGAEALGAPSYPPDHKRIPPEEGIVGSVVYYYTSAILTNQYLPGTAFQQMQRAATAAGIGALIDDGTLVIYTLTGPRRGAPVVISPTTGMVEYPSYFSQGLRVRTLFHPAIRFHGQVAISGSVVAQANRTWLVTAVDHALDSKVPERRLVF